MTDTNTNPETRDSTPTLTPPVNFFEGAEEFRLVADLPGVAQDDVQLDLERGELTLRAKRSLAREGKTLSLGRREGDFFRVVRLPDEVDATKAEASFEHGVLEIRLPKAEALKPRRIAINAMS